MAEGSMDVYECSQYTFFKAHTKAASKMLEHQMRKERLSRAFLMFLFWRFDDLTCFFSSSSSSFHVSMGSESSGAGSAPGRSCQSEHGGSLAFSEGFPFDRSTCDVVAALLFFFLFPWFCKLPRTAPTRWRKAQPRRSPSLQMFSHLVPPVAAVPPAGATVLRLLLARMTSTPACQQYFRQHRRCQCQHNCCHHSNTRSVSAVAAGPRHWSSPRNTIAPTNNLAAHWFPPQNVSCRTPKCVLCSCPPEGTRSTLSLPRCDSLYTAIASMPSRNATVAFPLQAPC